MIRVLIVDDSGIVRDMLKDFFHMDNRFEIAGEAINGKEALVKVRELKPDLVTMDIQMPEMNGLEATEKIMKESPVPIAIITSLDTAKMAYEATVKGAVEFFSKKDLSVGISEEKQKKILNYLHSLASINLKGKENIPSIALSGSLHPGLRDFLILLIGASTGGPNALLQILPLLPANLALPVVVVQHNSSGFEKSFTEWLDEHCTLDVKVAEHNEILKPGMIYVAPTEKHLEFESDKIILTDKPPINNQKPAVDVTFESGAAVFKQRAIGVILTGMGVDGARGISCLKEAGSYTIAQDEKTSLIFGMPRAAIETGKVDAVLPLTAIADQILKMISNKF